MYVVFLRGIIENRQRYWQYVAKVNSPVNGGAECLAARRASPRTSRCLRRHPLPRCPLGFCNIDRHNVQYLTYCRSYVWSVYLRRQPCFHVTSYLIRENVRWKQLMWWVSVMVLCGVGLVLLLSEVNCSWEKVISSKLINHDDDEWTKFLYQRHNNGL